MILVVDDDNALRTAICWLLRGAGYSVQDAADGTSALRRLRTMRVDLLITDIVMPNGDGIELISAVKREGLARRIIAISGRGSLGSVELLEMSSLLGADAAMAKPVSPARLLEQVADLMPSPAEGNRH
jgi:CheY-like chemotaxis protein